MGPRGQGRQADLEALLLLAPGLLLLLVFVYWPLLYNLWLSLHDWNLVRPKAEFVGLANYRFLLQDPLFGQLLRQSLLYMGLAL
ncbi:MAG: sugar ABC transporter permease, partial [Thermus sp.]